MALTFSFAPHATFVVIFAAVFFNLPSLPDERLAYRRNWSGEHVLHSNVTYRPRSVADVQAAVKEVAARGGKVKVVGHGHSWSTIAQPEDAAMCLDGMASVLHFDEARSRVTVEAGMRLFELLDFLRPRGLALHNLGSVKDQTLAGVIATGTHGTGGRLGNLATAVTAVTLVDGLGRVREVDEATPGDLLNAVRLHLGALGVLTSVTVQAVPAYRVHEVQTPAWFHEVLPRFRDLDRRNDHFKVWLEPHSGRALVFEMNKTSAPAENRVLFHRLAALKIELFDVIQKRVFSLVPWAIPAIMRALSGIIFDPVERTEVPETVLNIHHVIPVHREAEFAIPMSEAPAKLARLLAVIQLQPNMPIGNIIEIRTTRADSQWMSPVYRLNSGSKESDQEPFVFVTALIESADEQLIKAYFNLMEETLNGRPHYGKTFSRKGSSVTGRLPKSSEFQALMKEWDPSGVFQNKFLKDLFDEK